MNNRPQETTLPTNSRIAALVTGASFYDCWCITTGDKHLPALGYFIAAAARTPRWINLCMAMRNRIGSWLGLKDLGALSGLDANRPAASYQPGERVGIFTLIENNADEALIGDKDKHLNVVLSIHRYLHPESAQVTITITTVVHVNNWLGRLYMLPVKPMHRLIAPAVLAGIAQQAPEGKE